MIKTLLIILLAAFFIINGLNHLFNTKILEEYAHKRHLFSPKFSVLCSGIGLILGGIMLLFKPTQALGAFGLAFFVVLAAFLLHRFWDEKNKQEKMLEGQNFLKNFAIAIEMIYIAIG